MTTPMIDRVIKNQNSAWWFSGDETSALAAELRTLLAERDTACRERDEAVASENELQSRLAEYKSRENHLTPPRRLREYCCPATGNVYRVQDGVVQIQNADDGGWRSAVGVGVHAVAGVADLIANPEEPAPTLEGVVNAWAKSADVGPVARTALPDLCSRLRSAGFDAPRAVDEQAAVAFLDTVLDHYGVSRYVDRPARLAMFVRDNAHLFADAPRALTAAECVARLVELGAEQLPRSVMVFDQFATPQHRQNVRVLILPAEVTP